MKGAVELFEHIEAAEARPKSSERPMKRQILAKLSVLHMAVDKFNGSSQESIETEWRRNIESVQAIV